MQSCLLHQLHNHDKPCLSASTLARVCRPGHGQLQLAAGDPGGPAGAGAGRQRRGCRRGHGRHAGAGRADDEWAGGRHHGAGVVGQGAEGVRAEWQRSGPERRQPRSHWLRAGDAGTRRRHRHDPWRCGWLVRSAGALRLAVVAAAVGAGDRLRARGLSGGRIDRRLLGAWRRIAGTRRTHPAGRDAAGRSQHPAARPADAPAAIGGHARASSPGRSPRLL